MNYHDHQPITLAEWKARHHRTMEAKAQEVERELNRLDGGTVICVETGQAFDSPACAARWACESRSKRRRRRWEYAGKIRRAMRTGRVAYGYHWKRPGQDFVPWTQGRPVVRLADGKVFPNAAVAARTVGVAKNAIVQAAANGRRCCGERWAYAGKVYCGLCRSETPQCTADCPSRQPPEPPARHVDRDTGGPVVCVETGQRFDSPKQAALWAKGSRPYDAYVIRRAINSGGLGHGYHWVRPGRRLERATTARPVWCVETGQIFASCRAAAEAVGRNEAVIRDAVEDGKRCAGYRWAYVGQRPKEIPEKSRYQRVEMDGVVYTDYFAIARVLGISPRAASMACYRGRHYGHKLRWLPPDTAVPVQPLKLAETGEVRTYPAVSA